MLNKVNLLKLGVIAYAINFSFTNALANEPFAIYHAFDMHVNEISKKLKEIAADGYTHIQLPPMQRSGGAGYGNDGWFDRYQPIDFTVLDGRGNFDELQALAHKARSEYGIKLLGDAVFNHLKPVAKPEEWRDAHWYCGQGNCSFKEYLYSQIQYPTFSALDVHPWCDMQGNDWDNDNKRFECWGNGDWVDLNHSSVYVQNVLKRHIDILFDAGVEGLRYDAAKHIRPWAIKIFNDHAKWRNPYSWSYGEVLSTNGNMHKPYQAIMPSTDFLLTEKIVEAFSMTGDLRWLKVVPSIGTKEVTFARNHDTIFNDGELDSLKFKDRRDMELAWAFVLAREAGIPLVFKDDASWRVVKNGMKFRKFVGNAKETILGRVCTNCDNKNTLIMERGSKGFMIINKAAHIFKSGTTDFTLTNLEGCYHELNNNFNISIERINGKKVITRWGTSAKKEMEVGPRESFYFTQTAWEKCQKL